MKHFFFTIQVVHALRKSTEIKREVWRFSGGILQPERYNSHCMITFTIWEFLQDHTALVYWIYSFEVGKDKHGEDVLFVDRGVYTRNCNFRLYHCSEQVRSPWRSLTEPKLTESLFFLKWDWVRCSILWLYIFSEI